MEIERTAGTLLAEGGFPFSGLGVMSYLFVLVPAIMALMGLWMAISAARKSARVRGLLRERAVDGRVIASHVRTRTRNDSTYSELVETIEFTPAGSAQPVRGTPLVGDQGMVDRSGMQVRVHHDPRRPLVFIAPMTEGAFKTRGLLVQVGCGLAFTAFAVMFGLFALNFIRGFGDLGGF